MPSRLEFEVKRGMENAMPGGPEEWVGFVEKGLYEMLVLKEMQSGQRIRSNVSFIKGSTGGAKVQTIRTAFCV